MIPAVMSASPSPRLEAARAFLAARPAASEIVIVGASRGAADDVARAIAMQAGATFGLTRCSLIELAARAARTTGSASDAAVRRVLGTQSGAEATAARAVFEAVGAGELA